MWAEQIHRAARTETDLREQRGKRASQRVRRELGYTGLVRDLTAPADLVTSELHVRIEPPSTGLRDVNRGPASGAALAAQFVEEDSRGVSAMGLLFSQG